MTTQHNQSYAAVSSQAGEAGKLFSKAIQETEADRKAEARKVRGRAIQWENGPSLELHIRQSLVRVASVSCPPGM